VDAELEKALEDCGFSVETRLYRYTLPQFLTAPEPGAACRITANPAPEETVKDLYQGGLDTFSKDLGPGLTFCDGRENQWADASRALVEVRLGDVLDQGGRFYPVEFFEGVYYLTLPAGGAPVRKVERP
jgi:hypothetical protein